MSKCDICKRKAMAWSVITMCKSCYKAFQLGIFVLLAKHDKKRIKEILKDLRIKKGV